MTAAGVVRGGINGLYADDPSLIFTDLRLGNESCNRPADLGVSAGLRKRFGDVAPGGVRVDAGASRELRTPARLGP